MLFSKSASTTFACHPTVFLHLHLTTFHFGSNAAQQFVSKLIIIFLVSSVTPFVLLHTQINKVFLGNDSHGRGRGIFVEEIEVQCADEDPVIFPCRCWLAEDEGDGKTARVLVPGETIQPQLDSKKTCSLDNTHLQSLAVAL